MHRVRSVAAVLCLLIPLNPASAEPSLSDQQQQIRAQISELLDKLPAEDRAAVLKTLSPLQRRVVAISSAAAPKKTAGPNQEPVQSSDSSDSAPKSPATAFFQQNAKGSPFQKGNCLGFGFLLRQDWKDMGFSSCPITVDKATGAQFSYSNDLVDHNRSWLVHGTAAILYSSEVANKPGEYDLYRTSLGAYITVNRDSSSASSQTKNNINTIAYGGVAIFALSTPDIDWTHWFRVRGGGIEDDIKGTTSTNITAEWSPENSNLHIHYPYPQAFGLPLTARFDPEVLLQYNHATGKNQLLQFNNETNALRVGPQLSLKLTPSGDVPSFLERLTASVAYHWAYEVYSGGQFNLFQTGLTYNLDEGGNFAISTTYSRGRDEDTGAPTNLYKLGLSGKI
jgi:hypothetical protein